MSLPRTLWPLLLALLAAGPAAWAAPRVALLRPAAAWSLAEFQLSEVPAIANAFDPEQIRVDATVADPAGATRHVPGFWHQEFRRTLAGGAEQLTPAGEPHWRIRYTPTEPGEHTLRVTVARAGAAAPESAEIRFTVAAPAAGAPRGWVRVAEDRRTFATSDGRPLLLAGHNVCWPEGRGTADYERWFAELAAAGQNFARLWLAPWWAPLEHGPGSLTNYRLDAAWQLDQLFALAERHGLYLLLCFDHHGMYQPFDPTWGGSNAFWRSNPYNAAQGGPCAEPADFFRLPVAKAAYQKRLRYLVGRYSHSPRLLAWQFFNEIDNVFDRAPVDEATVVAWHVEMARWLRAHDPYQHLISTSLTGGVDRPAFWSLPELDFSSYHAYWEPAPARRVAALTADFVQRYGKPALIGEFGVSGADWAAAADPHLRGFRQNLWAGALGGGAATALSWWWEDLHADGALPLETVLTRFLRDGGWFDGGWAPAAIATPGRPPRELGEPRADAAPFTASLALNPFRRLRLDGEFAVTDALAAERASEHLTAALWGSREPGAQRRLRIAVATAAAGRLSVRVQETTGDAVLVGRVDGAEVWRVPYGGAGVVNDSFAVALPEGRHVIEIANEGADRIQLGAVELAGVQPSGHAGGWRYQAEAIGLRKGAEAIVYVVAPRAVYPAGAGRYRLPETTGETVTLTDWPAGNFTARWIDPESGREVATTQATTRDGRLAVPVPPFAVDLAARVSRTPSP